MVVSPIQTAFTGGEVSPRIRGRVDEDVYRRALAECRNFEPTPQGSLLMRGGSEYCADAASAQVRLLEMRTRRYGSFVLELTPLEMRIRDASSMVLQQNSPDLAVGGQFNSTLTGWLEGVQAGASDPYLISAGNWGCRLVRPGVEPREAYLRNKDPFAIAAGTNYVLSFEFVKRTAGDARLRVMLGTTEGGTEIADEYFDQLGPNVLAFNSGAAVALEVKFQLDADTDGHDAVFDNIQLRAAAGATVIVTPWDAEHLEALQVALEPATDRAYFVHSNVEPRRLVRNADGTWTLAALSTLVGYVAPLEWAGTNWPGVVELAQSRLWLGATPAEGHRLWASKTGIPQDFTLGTGLDNEAIDVKLATKGQLRWLKFGRALLGGTEMGEHSIASSTGAITPTDIQVRDESGFGAGSIPAVHAGPVALYASHDHKKIRAALYDLQTNGWNSKDVTFLAEHITAAVVKELHFARAPFGSIVCLLHDGTLAVCTFDSSEGVAAWWRYETDGTIRSIAVGDNGGDVGLWMAVTRANGTHLERLPWSAVGRYVDSFVSGAVAADGTFSGLAHLEGETVRVVVRGALEEDQVVAGGAVQAVTAQRIADDPALVGADVVVGLPYAARAVTLPFEGGSQRGSAQGAKKRFPRVGLVLNNSALPLVDGRRLAPDRTPSTPQDTPEPLYTGKARAATLGWSDDGQVTIEQDLPFRTEVLALYGVAAVNEV